MRMQKILFIIGLLTFITPVIALPPKIEGFIFIAYGLAVMIISSRINCADSKCCQKEKELHKETFSEKKPEVEKIPEQKEEQKMPDFNGVAEGIIEEEKKLEHKDEEPVQQQ